MYSTEKELYNQIKQIKKHVTGFVTMLTELNSGQACKSKHHGQVPIPGKDSCTIKVSRDQCTYPRHA